MDQLKKIVLITCLGLLAGNLSVPPASGQNLNWHSFDKALAITDTTSRHVLVDVRAPWCGWCRKMQKEVYPALTSTLSDHFILTHINRDDNQTTHRYKGTSFTSTRLAQHFKVQQVPAIVLLNPEGEYLMHISGYVGPDEFEPLLKYIATDATSLNLLNNSKRNTKGTLRIKLR